MRASFQVLVIPYRITDGKPLYCVLHRADHDEWQFIAGVVSLLTSVAGLPEVKE